MLTETLASTVIDVVFPITDSYTSVTPETSAYAHLSDRGAPNAHILVTGASPNPYRNEVPSAEVMDTLVGRIVAVRPNMYRTSWYVEAPRVPSSVRGIYLHGPVINPTPINGHHYRELRSEGTQLYVLRYNDDEHTEDRAAVDNPWTIPADGHLESTIGIEVQRALAPRMWVEINWPAPVTGASDTEIDRILSAEDAEDDVAPATANTIENTRTGRTKGLAAVEEGGTTLLDPELVTGQPYIVWDTTSTRHETRALVGYFDSESMISIVGYFYDNEADVEWNEDAYLGEYDHARDGVHWAKLADKEHVEEPEHTEERVAALLERRRDEFDKFEALNTALNVLADDEGWCGEYEENMVRIGMRSRRQSMALTFDPDSASVGVLQRHAWNIEVNVDFTGELDYVSSDVESAIERALSFSGSVSSVRCDATMTVTIEDVIADTEDEARLSISLSDVESAMDGYGPSYSEITDWNIESVDENEDFDWSGYDD